MDFKLITLILLLLYFAKGSGLSFIPDTHFNVTIVTVNNECSGYMQLCSSTNFCVPLQLPYQFFTAFYKLDRKQFGTENITISFSNVVCSVSDSRSAFNIKYLKSGQIMQHYFTDFVRVNSSSSPSIVNCPALYKPVVFSLRGCSVDYPFQPAFSLYRGDMQTVDNLILYLLFRLNNTKQSISLCLTDDSYLVTTTNFGKQYFALDIYLQDVSLPVYSFLDFGSSSFTFSSTVLLDSSTRWKITDTHDENWLSLSFSDAAWMSSEFSGCITHYYRTLITIKPEYRMITFIVSYVGGFVAYLNGVKVARFDLPSGYTNQTLGESSERKMEYFTVAVTGLASPALFCIEGHAPNMTVSSSLHIEAFPLIDPDALLLHSLDLTLSNGQTFHNPSISWSGADTLVLDSSVASPFMIKFTNRVNINFSTLDMVTNRFSKEERLYLNFTELIPLPPNITSFATNLTLLRYLDKRDFLLQVYRLRLHYKPITSMLYNCGDEYGMVEHNSNLTLGCPEGKFGYSLYQCRFGELHLKSLGKCKYELPSRAAYNTSKLTFYLGMYGESPVPEYSSTITEYIIFPSLDTTGLMLDKLTGRISGTPIQSLDESFIIGGTNPDYNIAFSFKMNIKVINPECIQDDIKLKWNEEIKSFGFWSSCLFGQMSTTCSNVSEQFQLVEKKGVCYLNPFVCIVIIAVVLAMYGIVTTLKKKCRHSRRFYYYFYSYSV